MVTITYVNGTQIKVSVPGLQRSHLQFFIKVRHPQGSVLGPILFRTLPLDCTLTLLRNIYINHQQQR